jgi:hypothetical protein
MAETAMLDTDIDIVGAQRPQLIFERFQLVSGLRGCKCLYSAHGGDSPVLAI